MLRQRSSQEDVLRLHWTRLRWNVVEFTIVKFTNPKLWPLTFKGFAVTNTSYTLCRNLSSLSSAFVTVIVTIVQFWRPVPYLSWNTIVLISSIPDRNNTDIDKSWIWLPYRHLKRISRLYQYTVTHLMPCVKNVHSRKAILNERREIKLILLPAFSSRLRWRTKLLWTQCCMCYVMRKRQRTQW